MPYEPRPIPSVGERREQHALLIETAASTDPSPRARGPAAGGEASCRAGIGRGGGLWCGAGSGSALRWIRETRRVVEWYVCGVAAARAPPRRWRWLATAWPVGPGAGGSDGRGGLLKARCRLVGLLARNL